MENLTVTLSLKCRPMLEPSLIPNFDDGMKQEWRSNKSHFYEITEASLCKPAQQTSDS
ncbi:MAG: hypothetical protein LBB36_00635 [Fibromonadaceae bacterium]|nr:hypothetical protein [Fibromonadaceae bacterium]